jgi:hypothetical protein
MISRQSLIAVAAFAFFSWAEAASERRISESCCPFSRLIVPDLISFHLFLPIYLSSKAPDAVFIWFVFRLPDSKITPPGSLACTA